MRKTWLRGMLLGVSLSLLLAGGAALAQGEFNVIDITSDPEGCLECTSDINNPIFLAVYSSGWQGSEYIHQEAWHDGDYLGVCAACYQAANGEYNDATWWAPECPGVAPAGSESAFDVGAQQDGDLGEWRFRLHGNTSVRWGEFTIMVAEDCSDFGFVPEPGTIALLGSGLVGLAGYATLRWRTRG